MLDRKFKEISYLIKKAPSRASLENSMGALKNMDTDYEYKTRYVKMAVPNTKCLILIFRRISASSSLAIGIL